MYIQVFYVWLRWKPECYLSTIQWLKAPYFSDMRTAFCGSSLWVQNQPFPSMRRCVLGWFYPVHYSG